MDCAYKADGNAYPPPARVIVHTFHRSCRNYQVTSLMTSLGHQTELICSDQLSTPPYSNGCINLFAIHLRRHYSL